MPSTSLEMHRNRFRPGLRSGPHWGSLQRSLRPLAGGEGARRVLPKNPTPSLALRASTIQAMLCRPPTQTCHYHWHCAQPTYLHPLLQQYQVIQSLRLDQIATICWRIFTVMRVWQTCIVTLDHFALYIYSYLLTSD